MWGAAPSDDDDDTVSSTNRIASSLAGGRSIGGGAMDLTWSAIEVTINLVYDGLAVAANKVGSADASKRVGDGAEFSTVAGLDDASDGSKFGNGVV